ncbi:SPOR domain-containing protein [Actinacidiphila bryophytorum]|uniref:SPOR domain-containing protein n=1 Tax=Actinacidiphila bryophytorum TaxID=1436133 RepID=UPI002176E4E9|nr:SPOR domain-containing protein [Actinacidiphila bryophytorum]UWE12446.1 SPOR domain-containing protein [Actinacidiphila bryophytorum]
MTSDLVWVLIRQDDGANRYRVGRYATRAEAERIADQLDGRTRQRGQDRGQEQGADRERRYVIERIAPRLAQA